MKIWKEYKVFIFCLLCFISIGVVGLTSSEASFAVTKKMTRVDFISGVVKSIEKSDKCEILINSNLFDVDKYITKYKISKKYAVNFAKAVYLGIVDDGSFKSLKRNISLVEAAKILAKANEIIYGVNYCFSRDAYFSFSDIKYVCDERISDVNKIKNEEDKVWFAKAYLYGFLKGKADDIYSKNRYFLPNSKPNATYLKKLIKMLNNTSKRINLSRDYQVCRTSNLPYNANLYECIIDSFPNDYYLTGFNGITEKGDVTEAKKSLEEKLSTTIGLPVITPKELGKFNQLVYPWKDKRFMRQGQEYENDKKNDEIVSSLVKASEEFYKYALNINYKTIDSDKEWYRIMSKYMDKNALDSYIEHCKINRTIIECDKVAADLSGCYWFDGMYNCKVYAHFRVLSDTPLSAGDVGADTDEKFGTLYPIKRGHELGDRYSRLILGPQYMNYKLGEWTDYFFNTNSSPDDYGHMNTSATKWDIMIDYTGDFPWLLKFPYRTND